MGNGLLPQNNIHEFFFDSDWPRAVQFKCNTSAKSVTLVQKCNASANYKLRRIPMLVQRNRLAKVIRAIPKITEINLRKDQRRVPKITRRPPKNFEHYRKIL